MKDQAIALCRISSDDQAKGHSLEAQNQSVKQASNDLDVDLVKIWTEVQTSKKGKNFGRKDMEEMLRYCKQNKRVKYLLIDFMSRLMREVEVMIYYKVLFNQMGVELHFCSASQQHLNGKDQSAQLLRLIEGFTTEQENLARAETTIARMKTRYEAGYYISHPHQGYVKSDTPGLHVPDPTRFEVLRKGGRLIIYKQRTVSQAVQWMNDRGYRTLGGKKLDVNHYIEFIVDRYYCGKIDIKSAGWPKNIDGLHERMFSPREHKMLVAAITKRNPRIRRKHNPEFAMANILRHRECEGVGHYEKFAGHFFNPGKRPSGRQRAKRPVYDCRDCRKRIPRQRIHYAITEYLYNLKLLPDEKQFREALIRVWRRQRGSVAQRLNILQTKKLTIEQKTKETAVSYTSETVEAAKDALRILLIDYDKQLKTVEADITSSRDIEMESEDFVKFAMSFVANIKDKWWSLSFENKARGEQVLFNGKIYADNSAKVHTPQLSSIYRLGTNKKALENASNAHLVELAGTAPASDGLPV